MKFLTRLFLFLTVSLILCLAGLQGASYFLLPSILERKLSDVFQAPVSVEGAGANFFTGAIYMKGLRIGNVRGFEEPDLLKARTVSIDIGVLSLLTSGLEVQRILVKDPVVTIEINQQGETNYVRVGNRLFRWMEKLTHKKLKWIHWITHYELGKIQLRRGGIRLIDKRNMERNWNLGSVSLSFARLMFPPDPEEALPAAVYLNAKVLGAREGQVLLIGRLHPFSVRQSFDLSGSLKDIELSEYNYFLPHFPLRFENGVLQAKVKALCHDGLLEMDSHARVDGLLLGPKPGEQFEGKKISGLPPKFVADSFNDLWDKKTPFEINSNVTGDLSDPNFNLAMTVRKSIQDAIYKPVKEKLEEQLAKTKNVALKSLENTSSLQ